MVTRRRRKIPENEYGNVNLAVDDVPKGCVYVAGKHLSCTCKAAGIDYVPAVVGFKKRRGFWKPIRNGVVIRQGDHEELLRRLEIREAGAEKRAEYASQARMKRWQQDADDLANLIREQFPLMPESDVVACADHATEIGSRRVGRSRQLEPESVAKAAVVAHARHEHTDYEEWLRTDDRETAREMTQDKLTEVIARWEGKSVPVDA